MTRLRRRIVTRATRFGGVPSTDTDGRLPRARRKTESSGTARGCPLGLLAPEAVTDCYLSVDSFPAVSFAAMVSSSGVVVSTSRSVVPSRVFPSVFSGVSAAGVAMRLPPTTTTTARMMQRRTDLVRDRWSQPGLYFAFESCRPGRRGSTRPVCSVDCTCLSSVPKLYPTPTPWRQAATARSSSLRASQWTYNSSSVANSSPQYRQACGRPRRGHPAHSSNRTRRHRRGRSCLSRF